MLTRHLVTDDDIALLMLPDTEHGGPAVVAIVESYQMEAGFAGDYVALAHDLVSGEAEAWQWFGDMKARRPWEVRQ